MSTKQDRDILNCVFNPLQPDVDCANEELVPEDLRDIPIDEDLSVVEEIKKLELKAIKEAENGRMQEAIDLFDQIIQMSPLRPATYNNRAQARRLIGDIDGALEDLDTAIRVSNGVGKSACLALCQRGLIHRLRDRNDEAKSDFDEAAAMGSRFAATQLVQMNSYAALCNDMLNKVLAMYRKY